MGHAIHFLERLKRVSDEDVELALHLYYHPHLIISILRFLQLPDSVERVAISLSSSDQGPYLVITNKGDFVTCLAHGMQLGELRMIEYERFSVLLAQAKEHEKNTMLAYELAGEKEITKLTLRLLTKAQNLSREDMIAISVMQPLLWAVLFVELMKHFEMLDVIRKQWKRLKRHKKSHEKILRQYWELHWGIGHFIVLIAWEGKRELQTLFQFYEELQQPVFLTWPVFRQGDLPLGLRAIWAIGKIGKPLLPSLKKQFLNAKTPLTWLEAYAGMMILALRHKKLQAEIEKVLVSQKKPSFQEHWSSSIEHLLELRHQMLASPDAMREQHFHHLQELLFHICQENHYCDDEHYQTKEELPRSLVLAFFVNLSLDYMNDEASLIFMFQMLPSLAMMEGKDLYMSAHFIEKLDISWQPEHTIQLLQRWEDHYGKTIPSHKNPKIGRNDPCPCGSGKKYKQCCMRSDK